MERRMEILRAIVEDYVATNEPVGSRVLAARHGLSISPATIRNEMAALEDEGLIIQPHTSAGRVPTDLGYRVFVDRLSTVKPLSAPERRAIDNFLEGAANLDDVIARTVRLLAQVTHQVAIVQYPSLTRSAVRHIEVLALASNRLMLVLIADTGRVEQRILDLPTEIGEKTLNALRSKLNTLSAGKKLAVLSDVLKKFEEEFSQEERTNIRHIVAVILEMSIEKSEERVVVSGTSNLARHAPDFNESVHPVLEALEEQVVLLRLLGEAVDVMKVKIGHEQENKKLHSTSVITTGYGPTGESVATLGIIGPTRMDYPTSMGAVSAVARYVSRFLQEEI
ncbi:MAG: heat-inducible transcriptional repressor HrcA [Actinobacteria bacterium]|uniref:Heat-inducible transcription repressor HrcA n=1 Tax=Candidatus Fonsibacter lacus TaxID=2576439 RepID=A0A965GC19_9PROT|nr:heat-inducible transcriptional repressor HrcA [Candidatus Fonsibacter lacus]